MRRWKANGGAGAGTTSNNSQPFLLKCTDLPQFDACMAQADMFQNDDKLHLRNLCNDSARCSSLIAIHTAKMQRHEYGPRRSEIHKIIVDYSRQRVTGETMEQLFDLADAVGLTERREAMYAGQYINITERRPVLHHVLRMPAYYDFEMATNVTSDGLARATLAARTSSDATASSVNSPMPTTSGRNQNSSPTSPRVGVPAPQPMNGYAVLKQVNESRQRIQEFAFRVRSGEYTSSLSHDVHLTNTLVVGSQALLGPAAVAKALMADPDAAEAAGPYRQLRFITNIDPVDVKMQTHNLKAAKTLVIIVSTKFSPGDPTLLLARTVLKWLVEDIKDMFPSTTLTPAEIINRHVAVVTCNPAKCESTFPEVSKENIFLIPSWVNPRFSLFSPIGLLPLSLQYSYPVLQEVMEGAHDMDEHFFQAPLRDNLPVILGLLGVWNSTFLGVSNRAIIPYSQALSDFPAYIQHIDMESNGKRVALDGTPLLHRSGEVTFGAAASTCQYSFFQLFHQGRVVPIDFIGFMESSCPTDLPGEAVSNHDELMSHFFGQPDALAYGKTMVDLIQEQHPEPVREHMVVTGNRPSTSILLTSLDAFAIGQLLALYEHRTAVQGFIWGINSFDQYGNELGTTLAKHVRSQLAASRKTGASVQGFNSSTSTLLEHYLAHGRQQNQRQEQPRDTYGTNPL